MQTHNKHVCENLSTHSAEYFIDELVIRVYYHDPVVIIL